MQGIGKWVLIAIGAFIAWRLLNGFLNNATPYTVQSSNYIGPSYPQVGYGFAGANYGLVGGYAWPGPNGGYGYAGGAGGGIPWGRPRRGQPGGSVRW